MSIWHNIYKGLAYIGLERPSNFNIVEYCEIFKMTFSKIQSSHKILVMTEKVKTVIEIYFFTPPDPITGL